MGRQFVVEINTILFLIVVVVGAVVQTVTGFALGLIIMAGVALFNLADIAFAAAVVSFISLANATVALRRGYRHVDVRMAVLLLGGLVPAMVVGIVLLEYLSDNYYTALKLLLGIVIVLAGVSMMISPSPYDRRSGDTSFLGCGALGGLLAGLYSAGGPPIAYFIYRQPLAINVIRFSLLAVIAVSTLARAVAIGVAGQLNLDILKMSAISIPLVIVVTLGVARVVHLVPELFVRRLVFLVLLLAGGFLVALSLPLA